MTTSTDGAPRLTSLAHGGGCGCKIGPAVLAELLRGLPRGPRPEALLVGAETSDDAAIWQIDAQRAIVSTTDFFMPIVDDPFDFGRIAATNALSDVWAMGGVPLFALALLGMPIQVLAPSVISAILAGGAAACAAAGVPVAGGHSIDSVEPIYGLAVTGMVELSHLRRNAAAQLGDQLILAKPVGVGVLSAAFKKGALDADGYATLLAMTTQLNAVGHRLAGLPGLHAMTDVTGFGLLGHLSEMARGADLHMAVSVAEAPVLPLARALRTAGFVTGASGRNWTAVSGLVEGELSPIDRDLLTDPQTAGGLLIAVAENTVEEAMMMLKDAGFPEARCFGEAVGAGAKISLR